MAAICYHQREQLERILDLAVLTGGRPIAARHDWQLQGAGEKLRRGVGETAGQHHVRMQSGAQNQSWQWPGSVGHRAARISGATTMLIDRSCTRSSRRRPASSGLLPGRGGSGGDRAG